MGDQGFERALVGHRDNPALDSPPQQFAARSCGPFLVRGLPARGLGINIGKQFGKRFEFDKAVKGEGDGVAVFGNYCGGSDQGLQWDLLRAEEAGIRRV